MTFEDAARREFAEETGLNIEGELTYLGSHQINDWRYRWERDKIITTFFHGFYSWGKARPGDDLDDVDWFDLEKAKDILVDSHWILHRALTQYLK